MWSKNSDNPFFQVEDWKNQDTDDWFSYPDAYFGKKEQSERVSPTVQETQETKRTVRDILGEMDNWNLESLSPIEIIRLRRHHSLKALDVPPELESIYKSTLESYAEELSTPSPIETQVFNEVLTNFPDAIHSHWIDGIECDIYIPSLDIIIMVDSRFHKSRANRDQEVREYIEGQHNFDIIPFHSREEEIDKNIKLLLQYLKRLR